MRFLIVRAHGGLCNRMRALLSAADYAEATDRRLFFSWLVTDRFGAKLEDLWEHDFSWLPSRVVSGAARLSGGYTPVEEIDDRASGRCIVLHSNAVLRSSVGLPSWTDRLRSLMPVPCVRERTFDFWRQHLAGHSTVGVMIRAHADAHGVTQGSSPPEWFFERMDSIRAEHPEVRFFLSTDNPEVSAEAHRRFSGLAELPAKSGHNTLGGIRDAICDLYLLGSTHYVLGSHWSSFSETAGALRGQDAYETPLSPAAACVDEALRRETSGLAHFACDDDEAPHA